MAQQTVVVDIALLGKMAGYIEMLVKDPYSTAFAALSDIYRTFGLLEEAVAVAQKGSEMVPTYAPGFVALGRALAEKGDPARACNAYRQALIIEPANLAALTGLASSCLGCGQNDEALALLAQAELIDPDDDVVKQLFSVVKKLTASHFSVPTPKEQDFSVVPPPHQSPLEVAKALTDDQADLAVGTTQLPPIATATLADIYIKQGFPERALKVFHDLLVADPGNSEIRQRHDALLQQINEAAQAKPHEAVSVPVEIPPDQKTLFCPEGAGKEALVALYGRWLDAINGRRADVH